MIARRPARGAAALLVLAAAAPGPPPAGAAPPGAQPAPPPPPPPPVVGRWDLRVAGPNGVYPSWLEVTRSGNESLVGRFVGRVGSARPIGRVEYAGGVLRFAIPPQWEAGRGDLRVEGTLAGDTLAGTLVTPDGERHRWTGRRAPALLRAGAPRWGAPVVLFDGRTLAGWAPRGTGASRWRAAGGVLANTGPGANLATTAAFGDFKLHLEFRLPPGGNSGVYLRGRYEVQVEDDEATPAERRAAEPAANHLGAVYGFVAPNEYAGRGPGVWQAYDLTLVGRRVTVALNGRLVVDGRPVPGITGGALDSDEGAPGPLLLQGDHGPVEYRNIVLTPAAP